MRLLERPGGSPQGRGESAPNADDAVDRGRRLCCAACGNPVTTSAARTEVSGAHQHTFCNPHGHVFDIACFREAPGAVAVGDASDFFSWFPGYAWCVGICRGCKAHLGWEFGDAGAAGFWGLIVDRLAEGEDPS